MINRGDLRFPVFREDRGRYSLSDLAEGLGDLTVGRLCATRYRMSRRLRSPEETDLRATLKALVRSLSELAKLK